MPLPTPPELFLLAFGAALIALPLLRKVKP